MGKDTFYSTVIDPSEKIFKEGKRGSYNLSWDASGYANTKVICAIAIGFNTVPLVEEHLSKILSVFTFRTQTKRLIDKCHFLKRFPEGRSNKYEFRINEKQFLDYVKQIITEDLRQADRILQQKMVLHVEKRLTKDVRDQIPDGMKLPEAIEEEHRAYQLFQKDLSRLYRRKIPQFFQKLTEDSRESLMMYFRREFALYLFTKEKFTFKQFVRNALGKLMFLEIDRTASTQNWEWINPTFEEFFKLIKEASFFYQWLGVHAVKSNKT